VLARLLITQYIAVPVTAHGVVRSILVGNLKYGGDLNSRREDAYQGPIDTDSRGESDDMQRLC